MKKVAADCAFAALFLAASLFIWCTVAADRSRQLEADTQATIRYCAEATALRLDDLLSRMDRVAGSFNAGELSARDRVQLTSKVIRAVGLLPEVGSVSVLDQVGHVLASSQVTMDEGLLGQGPGSGFARVVLASSPDRVSLQSLPTKGAKDTRVIGVRRIEDARNQLTGLVVLVIRASTLDALTTPSWASRRVVLDLFLPGDTVSVSTATPARPLTWLQAMGRVLASGVTVSPPARIEAVVSLPNRDIRVRARLDPTGGDSFDDSVANQGGSPWLAFSLATLGLVSVLAVASRPLSVSADTARLSSLESDLTAMREGRDRVLASVGHDLRTSLTSIRGFALLLQESDLRDEQRHWVDMTLGSTQSQLDLLSGLLETANGGDGAQQLRLDEVNIVELVQSVSSVMEGRASEKGLDLKLHVSADLSGIWHTDPTRLRQILSNLIDNAIKYTSHGNITISASLRAVHAKAPDEQESRTIVISVADTGPGIPVGDRNRIFEAYERGSLQDGAKEGGVGLGLAICKNNAAILNGSLELESTVGQGTEFTLEFPAVRLRDELRQIPFSGRIAVVAGFEDSRRRKLARRLESAGFTVETAADGYVGLGVAERAASVLGGVDLIVVDGSMTRLAAPKFIDRLRLNTAHERTRVVWVGTEGDAGIEAARPYADVFVPPPSSEDDVLSAASEVMEGLPNLALASHGADGKAGGRILVVEDNRPNQQMLSQFLSSKGFVVFTADNGEDAVRSASRGGFDAILMDIQLPGIDGYDATRRIRALGGTAASMPILGQTALTGPILRRRCREAGMTDVIEKTQDLYHLVSRLRDYIADARQESSRAASETRPERSVDPAPARPDAHVRREALRALVETLGLCRTRGYIEGFVRDAVALSAYLADLIPGWEAKAIERVCHDLSGMAGNLGAHEFVETLNRILAAVQHGNRKATEREVAEAERQASELRQTLIAELGRLASDTSESA